jgi:hypothetical protein
VHAGAAGVGGERVEAQGPRQVDDGRRHHRHHGGRHLGDGVVGRGDDEDVDAAGGAGQIVAPAEEPGELPAARGERGGEGRAGPARTDDADRVHLTSFGVPAPDGVPFTYR